jgi:dienelactone hydrolase
MATVPATAGTPALPAYIARPAGSTPAPAVLVLHGCEGYSQKYAAIADGLAKAGYVSVAIDTLSPRGVENACTDRSGSRVEAEDARATLAWMRTQPYVDGARLALLGYSMGAIAILDIVDPSKAAPVPAGLQAAVAYYPACRNRDAAHLVLPLRILDGDADDWTPVAPCRELTNAATAAGKTLNMTTYPGATHAFNVDAPDRDVRGHHLRFDAAASTDAATQTLNFLHTYLLSTHP